jgi:TM2 domain-containing membrane protein YozV
MANCPQCGAGVAPTDATCRYCGEALNVQQQAPYNQQGPTPFVQQQFFVNQGPGPMYKDKSKIAAGVLGILLGGLGIHKFYLGRVGLGILYILFCWTGIPSIIGLIEGIIYLTMDDMAFREKYCRI